LDEIDTNSILAKVKEKKSQIIGGGENNLERRRGERDGGGVGQK